MCRHPNVNDVVPGLIVLNADDFVRIADDQIEVRARCLGPVR